MTDALDKTIKLTDSFFLKIGTKEGRQKVSIGLTGTGSHFTITNNGDRRVINAHITYDDRTRPMDKLCELSYFTWARLMARMRQQLLPLQQPFFLSRTVNLGRLKRHGLFFITGNPDTDTEKAIVKTNNNKTFIRSRKEVRYGVFPELVKYPEDIQADAAKFYFLFSPNRKSMQGLIYRNPAVPHSKRYFFITNKMYRQFCKEQNNLLYSILTELNFKNKDSLLRLFEDRIIAQSNNIVTINGANVSPRDPR